MNYEITIGLVAGALTSFSGLPQLIRIIKLKETKDISLGTYSMLFFGVLLWLVYGLMLNDIAVIAANIVAIVFIGLILFYKLRYG